MKRDDRLMRELTLPRRHQRNVHASRDWTQFLSLAQRIFLAQVPMELSKKFRRRYGIPDKTRFARSVSARVCVLRIVAVRISYSLSLSFFLPFSRFARQFEKLIPDAGNGHELGPS